MEQEEYKKGIWPELPEKNMAAAVLTSGGNSGTNQLLASELLLQARSDSQFRERGRRADHSCR